MSPHLGLSDSELAKYKQKAEGRLADIRTSLTWIGSSPAVTLRDLSYMASQFIVPVPVSERDLVFTGGKWIDSPYGDKAAGEAAVSAPGWYPNALSDALVALYRVRHSLSQFGIGSVRSAYYINACACYKGHEQRKIDPLNIGSFEEMCGAKITHGKTLKNHWVERRPKIIPHTFSPRPAALDWLAYDLYLSDILDCLGVSWETLEWAAHVAFVDHLPDSYREQVTLAASPIIELCWRHDVERWLFHEQYSLNRTGKDRGLLKLIYDARMPQFPGFDRYAPYLEQFLERPRWMLSRTDIVARTRKTSPLLFAVFHALTDCLLRNMVGRKQVPAEAPEIAQTINDKWRIYEKMPAELIGLVVDVVAHIPVVGGLPRFQTRFEGDRLYGLTDEVMILPKAQTVHTKLREYLDHGVGLKPLLKQ